MYTELYKIYTEISTSYKGKSASSSNYKHRNSSKDLVGMALKVPVSYLQALTLHAG